MDVMCALWWADHLHTSDVIEFMFSCSSILGALDWAAFQGNLGLVKILVDNGVQGDYAMALAAMKGHNDVVQYLHRNHIGEYLLGTPIDHAACNGHLDVLKWLYDHTNQQFSVNALDWSCRYGHFEIVKWLCERRPDIRHKNAIRLAQISSHFHIAEWLCDNMGNQ